MLLLRTMIALRAVRWMRMLRNAGVLRCNDGWWCVATAAAHTRMRLATTVLLTNAPRGTRRVEGRLLRGRNRSVGRMIALARGHPRVMK